MCIDTSLEPMLREVAKLTGYVMRPPSGIRTHRTSRMPLKQRELWRLQPSYATKSGAAS